MQDVREHGRYYLGSTQIYYIQSVLNLGIQNYVSEKTQELPQKEKETATNIASLTAELEKLKKKKFSKIRGKKKRASKEKDIEKQQQELKNIQKDKELFSGIKSPMPTVILYQDTNPVGQFLLIPLENNFGKVVGEFLRSQKKIELPIPAEKSSTTAQVFLSDDDVKVLFAWACQGQSISENWYHKDKVSGQKKKCKLVLVEDSSQSSDESSPSDEDGQTSIILGNNFSPSNLPAIYQYSEALFGYGRGSINTGNMRNSGAPGYSQNSMNNTYSPHMQAAQSSMYNSNFSPAMFQQAGNNNPHHNTMGTSYPQQSMYNNTGYPQQPQYNQGNNNFCPRYNG